MGFSQDFWRIAILWIFFFLWTSFDLQDCNPQYYFLWGFPMLFHRIFFHEVWPLGEIPGAKKSARAPLAHPHGLFSRELFAHLLATATSWREAHPHFPFHSHRRLARCSCSTAARPRGDLLLLLRAVTCFSCFFPSSPTQEGMLESTLGLFFPTARFVRDRGHSRI